MARRSAQFSTPIPPEDIGSILGQFDDHTIQPVLETPSTIMFNHSDYNIGLIYDAGTFEATKAGFHNFVLQSQVGKTVGGKRFYVQWLEIYTGTGWEFVVDSSGFVGLDGGASEVSAQDILVTGVIVYLEVGEKIRFRDVANGDGVELQAQAPTDLGFTAGLFPDVSSAILSIFYIGS